MPDTLIDIVRSFHDNMNASIRVDGELLVEIKFNNSLRQRCSIAPILFNLYMWVVGERWLSRVAEMDDVGSYLRYMFDQQLFRRYTRKASEDTIKECQFADNVSLLATTRKDLKQQPEPLV